jgi:Domain of unknown function (DUF4386)
MAALLEHLKSLVKFSWILLLFGFLYVETKAIDEDKRKTTEELTQHFDKIFRFGIVSDLFGAVILIFLTLAFYRLFQGVDQNLAVLVVIFGGVMPALIIFVGVVSDAAALTLVRGADFLSVFDKPQRDALAMLFLRLRDHQNTAAEILWGLWLLPLAILTYRSRFLPRFLGVWLTINGFAYVLLSLTGELLPQYQNKVFIISQPALFAEVAFMLWLVIKGAKPPAPDAAASSSSAG